MTPFVTADTKDYKALLTIPLVLPACLVAFLAFGFLLKDSTSGSERLDM